MILSKLKKIGLREVWGHEALDFTSWLAKQENLDLLGQEIGIDISLIKTEANVGKFSVDILAEEEGTNRKIIIENQLENTDHNHLGKIITYASGYDAEIIIWIVRDVSEEHQKAVEWLNERTDTNTSFFLIRIELWQIEESNPAPKFEIIVSPNEWAKTIKSSATNNELTETGLQQLEFWKKLIGYARENDFNIRRTPVPRHWYIVSMGTSEAYISLTITHKNLLGCEIYISRNKELFYFLKNIQEKIVNEIGDQVEWIEASKASRIKITKKVDNIFCALEAEKHFSWLHQKTILFQKIFGKYIKEFNTQ
jgi:hypothetical protein